MKFSVLMAVYHGDDPVLLKKALMSIFANSLMPNEIILVADGILGDSLESVLKDFDYIDELIIHRLPENKGLANALNYGLSKTSYEFIIRADADDINLKDRFLLLTTALQSGFDLVGSSILEVERSGKPIAIRSVPLSREEIFLFAKKRNPFNHMSVAYRKSSVLSCGGYPNIYLKEDYALWALMLQSGFCAVNLPSILVHATAGLDMYKRRGGMKYVYSEYLIQQHLVNCGVKSWPKALIHGLIRSLVFIFPSFIRGVIYKNFLRSSLNYYR